VKCARTHDAIGQGVCVSMSMSIEIEASWIASARESGEEEDKEEMRKEEKKERRKASDTDY